VVWWRWRHVMMSSQRRPHTTTIEEDSWSPPARCVFTADDGMKQHAQTRRAIEQISSLGTPNTLCSSRSAHCSEFEDGDQKSRARGLVAAFIPLPDYRHPKSSCCASRGTKCRRWTWQDSKWVWSCYPLKVESHREESPGLEVVMALKLTFQLTTPDSQMSLTLLSQHPESV